jgi:hypothetical protein
LEEVIGTLTNDVFWRVLPIRITCVQVIDMRKAPDDHRPPSEAQPAAVYTCDGHGWVSDSAIKGLYLLRQPPDLKSAPPIPEFRGFVETRDLLMSLTLDPPVRPDQRRPRRPAVRSGEASIGKPGCGCAPRFLPFGFNPVQVAATLRSLRDPAVIATNSAEGEPIIVITGESTEEMPGLQWRVGFARRGKAFVPIQTEVYDGPTQVSRMTAMFDGARGYYCPQEIHSVAFRAGKPAGAISLKEIRLDRGAGHPRLAEIEVDRIPPGVIVNDYRKRHSFAYIMGYRPPTEAERESMATNPAAIIEYHIATQVSPFATADPTRLAPRTLWLCVLLGMVLGPLVVWVKHRRARASS